LGSAPPIAKVTCPTSTGYFPRHRLYRLLDKARKTSVLWITGPPGCGKTALVSSYIESRRIPCVWYKVDEADADLSTFFYYLGLAAAKASPRKRKRLPLLTPERMPGVSVFAQRYFEELSSMLPVPSLLVFDDCHRVREDSTFFETIREGISRLAPGIVAVLVSRSDPHPSFARDRANRLMETFGWEDLRLTLEEATGIVKLQRKGRSPPGLVRDLLEWTDGWAAGLVLLLERGYSGGLEPRAIGRQMPAEIIDYFGSEIFRRLDGERRGFLLRTAFLPRMTASMAERLTGMEGSGSILSEMNRHNQFTKKYLQREPVYEYHDLFREFLLERATAVYSGEQLSGIRKAVAALLEESGYVEDASVLFREAGDWEALSRLILSQAGSLVAQGRYQTLLEWLGSLPNEVRENDPWLLYWNGICLMPFSPAESRARFVEALHSFDARQEAAGVFRSWAGVVESIVMPMDNLTIVDAWISLLPRLLEKYGGLPSGALGDEITCGMYRALSFRQYPRAAVELWTPRALAVAKSSKDARLKFLLTLGIWTTYLTKDTREAERVLASLRELLKLPDVTPLMRLLVDMLEAILMLVIARPERCLQVTADGLAFAENLGVHIADPFLEAYSAMAALKLGDFETANRCFDRMTVTLGTMKPLPSGLFHCIAACEALHRRDLAKAAFHSKECLRLWEESGFTTHIPSAHILVAHVSHALDEDVDAARHLAEARRIGSETEIPIGVWLSYLTEAYFHLERKDIASVITPLKKGLQIGRENGMLGTTLWLPDMFERIAGKALEEGIEVDYVRDIIRRHRLVPDLAKPYTTEWPWPVKVYTLGRFGLLADDRPVEFGRKVQQRPLSLLKALVALGGREVPEARLAELLWPESDGDMAHHSFIVALSRLRKLLGKEEALVLKEGRLSLSNRHCWVDVWAFERFLGQAEKARKEGKETEAIRLSEKALSLYRGPFLSFEELSFAVSRREKLRGGFLGAVTHLGKRYEEAGRWEEAVSCYGKGLEADDLAEELYRRLMVCHLRQGQEAKALSVYRRCRKTLSSILGVDPSAETRAIAASLGRS
jgi:LuxR family transcriptional regulator, maltose regulon positive regulatory protein